MTASRLRASSRIRRERAAGSAVVRVPVIEPIARAGRRNGCSSFQPCWCTGGNGRIRRGRGRTFCRNTCPPRFPPARNSRGNDQAFRRPLHDRGRKRPSDRTPSRRFWPCSFPGPRAARPPREMVLEKPFENRLVALLLPGQEIQLLFQGLVFHETVEPAINIGRINFGPDGDRVNIERFGFGIEHRRFLLFGRSIRLHSETDHSFDCPAGPVGDVRRNGHPGRQGF